ncbi:hypothetical protein F5884DRAFT_746326 [Xylogone sp. PMI_703]|nr:hypothetical protein F5884DRAFT_746326 [Xylogone sp. PMI_703]
MNSSTALRKILIWGAGGNNIGHWAAESFAEDPAFDLTILARASSRSQFPQNSRVININDSLPMDDLIKAFTGQDLIISAIGSAVIESERKFIDAAVRAGVKRFIPSEFGINNSNPMARELSPIFEAKGAIQDYLRTKESADFSWTSVTCGLWLDW